MIYLDNAATTGRKPPSVIRAVESGLRYYSANPGRGGHAPAMAASVKLYAAREKAAAFFGASGAENVVFTLNCTHSINCVIKGVTKPGDRVVTSTLEHNAVMRPLIKSGVTVDAAPVSLTDDEQTLREFETRITDDTKLVICTAASNVFGKILPLTEIGRLCRNRGVRFAVDAAQLAGVMPINMQTMGIDYLCVAPHKGLYAPMGIGMLICEKPIENTLLEGGTGVNSLELTQPDSMPERLESGTVGLPLAMGTAAGIDYVNHIGIHKLYEHEMHLCRFLYHELKKLPFVRLYAPAPASGQFAPVVSFNIKDRKSEAVARFLGEKGIAVRGGFHCAPAAHRAVGTLADGTVRVSVAAFNTTDDIKALVMAVKKAKNL